MVVTAAVAVVGSVVWGAGFVVGAGVVKIVVGA